MGFGADIKTKLEKDKDAILSKILPEDLLKYGLIPEFVGRLPVLVTLQALDEDALIKILNEPKNSLVKQYKKLFELDGVELEFDKKALNAIAHKAIDRNTGARGLRSIIEDIMRDIMYEIPSREDIQKVIITKETIEKSQEPMLILGDAKKKKPPTKPAQKKETFA